MILPLTLRLDEMARMVNCELTEDPIYAGLEIQVFDDDKHGRGVLVFLERRADNKIDVYHQPGLRLERSGYAIGAGLGLWRETAIEPAVVAVTATGVHVDVALVDANGRGVEVRIDDRDRRRRRPAALLAPMGAAIERPTSLPLVWMPGFDLVRRSGREPEILIDGRPASTGRLPGQFLHRRRLIKYSEGLCLASVNPAHDGPLPAPDPDAGPGVVTASAGGHRALLQVNPPLPDPEVMTPGEVAEGTWTVAIDTALAVTGGTWRATRGEETLDLGLEVTKRWRPRRLPLLMRIVTTVIPVFRRWPTTYRWEATIELGAQPAMRSRWTRTGEAGAGSYRRATGH